jgi:hypothetical protein
MSMKDAMFYVKRVMGISRSCSQSFSAWLGHTWASRYSDGAIQNIDPGKFFRRHKDKASMPDDNPAPAPPPPDAPAAAPVPGPAPAAGPRASRRVMRALPVKPPPPRWRQLLPVVAVLAVAVTVAVLFYRFGTFRVQWSEFASEEGRFRVSFPGSLEDLQVDTMKLETGLGPLPVHAFIRNTGDVDSGASFFVVYFDPPPESIAAPPEQLLDRLVEHSGVIVTGSKDRTVASSRPLTLGRHAGREARITMRLAGREILGTVRVYLAGTRIYRLMHLQRTQLARLQQARLHSVDPAPFFDSFALLGE